MYGSNEKQKAEFVDTRTRLNKFYGRYQMTHYFRFNEIVKKNNISQLRESYKLIDVFMLSQFKASWGS